MMAQLEDRGVAVLRADCYERSSLVRLYRHQRMIAYLYSVHTVVASTRLAKYTSAGDRLPVQCSHSCSQYSTSQVPVSVLKEQVPVLRHQVPAPVSPSTT